MRVIRLHAGTGARRPPPLAGIPAGSRFVNPYALVRDSTYRRRHKGFAERRNEAKERLRDV
jgi:hypothetical protein